MDCGNRSFFDNRLVTIIGIVIIIVIDKNHKITSAITQPASTALIIINICILFIDSGDFVVSSPSIAPNGLVVFGSLDMYIYAAAA
jgi:hypothetical protein